VQCPTKAGQVREVSKGHEQPPGLIELACTATASSCQTQELHELFQSSPSNNRPILIQNKILHISILSISICISVTIAHCLHGFTQLPLPFFLSVCERWQTSAQACTCTSC